MRIVVISCWAYRDCWVAMLKLLDKYWPDHPPVHILTDAYMPFNFESKEKPRVFVGEGRTWCERVAYHAAYLSESDDGVCCLIQEDMFLRKPVNVSMLDHALKLLQPADIGLVRFYPSPAGTGDIGDPYFAEVPNGDPYRISCHAGFWKTSYLHAIALGANYTTGEARDFENLGSPHSVTLPQRVLAIKYGVDIPFEYHCTAITRGSWDPNAIKLCAEHGIDLDLSLRPVAVG